MTFGQKLRAARKEKGLTQKELAARIEVKHNSVSNWENDQNRPDLNVIKRISGALEVSMSFLLDEDEPLARQPGDFNRLLGGTEFALFDAVRYLSEEDKQDILDFVLFKVDQQEKRRGK